MVEAETFIAEVTAVHLRTLQLTQSTFRAIAINFFAVDASTVTMAIRCSLVFGWVSENHRKPL